MEHTLCFLPCHQEEVFFLCGSFYTHHPRRRGTFILSKRFQRLEGRTLPNGHKILNRFKHVRPCYICCKHSPGRKKKAIDLKCSTNIGSSCTQVRSENGRNRSKDTPIVLRKTQNILVFQKE